MTHRKHSSAFLVGLIFFMIERFLARKHIAALSAEPADLPPQAWTAWMSEPEGVWTWRKRAGGTFLERNGAAAVPQADRRCNRREISLGGARKSNMSGFKPTCCFFSYKFASWNTRRTAIIETVVSYFVDWFDLNSKMLPQIPPNSKTSKIPRIWII